MSAEVKLWGRTIGAVIWDPDRAYGIFEYEKQFAQSGIEVSPITMPTSRRIYQFPELRESFHGLPGLVADSLPDKFGNRLIDAWLASQGRAPGSMNPVERLCYIGRRGMGALEFEPAAGPQDDHDSHLNIGALTELTNKVLSKRGELNGILNGSDADQVQLQNILRVGTSAGGARAKALLLWNPKSGEFRSGQLAGPDGFEHWMLKFDGISDNRDRELADPMGFGRLEYAYHLMAIDAGIDMMPCRLHEERGRSHFMTRRFDRTVEGKKIHMLSLAAMCHYDYNDPGSYSYEQAMQVIRRISDNPIKDAEQQFLRTVFNVMARNQDDHVKNITFLMDPVGRWRLSPAYDVAYSYNPEGDFTKQHQMSINGKRDQFVMDDLMSLATLGGIKSRQAKALVFRVRDRLDRWSDYIGAAGVDEEMATNARNAHRLDIVD